MDSFTASSFIEQYIDANETISSEMQLRATDFFTIDVENRDCLSGALSHVSNYCDAIESSEKKKHFKQLMSFLHKIDDIYTERARLISEIQEVVDSKHELLSNLRGSYGDKFTTQEHSGSSKGDAKSSHNVKRLSSKKKTSKQLRSENIRGNISSKKTSVSAKLAYAAKSTPRQNKSSSNRVAPAVPAVSGKKQAKSKRRETSSTRSDADSSSSESSKEGGTRNPNDPLYCVCNRVSFGEMIACDNDNCPLEWFHFNCVNVHSRPKGKWYCPKCRLGDSAKVKRPEA